MTKCLLTMHGFKKVVTMESPLPTIVIPIAHFFHPEAAFPYYSKWLFKLYKTSPDLKFAYYNFWKEV